MKIAPAMVLNFNLQTKYANPFTVNCFYLKKKKKLSVMPADIVANGIIVVAVECGKRHEKR